MQESSDALTAPHNIDELKQASQCYRRRNLKITLFIMEPSSEVEAQQDIHPADLDEDRENSAEYP